MEDYEYDDFEAGNETIAVGEHVYDEAALLRQQEALMEAARKAAYVPEAIKEFILYFQKCLHEKNVYELLSCYDNSFRKLTEKFYKNLPWPSPELAVAPIVNNDQTFLLFYKELYYRHLYAKGQPTIEQRLDSYHNYCTLFDFIINSETPTDIELPTQWCWDMIDEFIYQFNSFSIFRSRLIKKGNASQADLELLEKNVGVWGAYPVLNVLYSLAGKANITAQLKATKNGQDATQVAGPFGSKPLYNTLGYFSLIGLLRVHTLLGDYALALKTLEDVQLNKRALLSRVTGAHYTTYYYVGFCYLMLRRYADAIKSFSHILVFISRTKNINRNAQFDNVNKKSDQMYALLAICVALCPTRLDDIIHTGMREKYGEQLSKMNRGGPDALKTFEELFVFAAPKFISPTPPDFEHPEYNVEPLQHHLKIFLETVKTANLGYTLKNYLNLYATMDIRKLSGFLETDVELLRSALVSFKIKNKQTKWTEGALLDGESVNVSEIDIALDNDLIHIAESKDGRKFADWFIRNTLKNYTAQEFIANPDSKQDQQHDKSKKQHNRPKKDTNNTKKDSTPAPSTSSSAPVAAK
ncbi:hypothetical protein AWJ20_3896 [Sugiyamaella lignohabitans]|uniref:Eukaryotic translation initiation factor 3 subunit L n=1 Tax=Sugiyamaella lignohabitans TaxID=796027 RepID=A0A167C1C3_9ASCO|nr:uncharacterized protein AWJ20_3896 [Sugiyamaella lignohabitans]ANB11099.1 hypothetical protein AWJ20_3896 [Sugiyamaella lignohabitans]